MNTEAILVVLRAKENKEKGEGANVEGRGVSFIRYGGKPSEESPQGRDGEAMGRPEGRNSR